MIDIEIDTGPTSPTSAPSAEFGHYRHLVWEQLRDEVLIAQGLSDRAEPDRRRSREPARQVSRGWGADAAEVGAGWRQRLRRPPPRIAGRVSVARLRWSSTVGLVIAARRRLAVPAELGRRRHDLRPAAQRRAHRLVAPAERRDALARHQGEPVRALGGFAIAVAIGVPLGLLIGWYRLAAEVLNPVLELFRNTAALSLLPVFILILGIGEFSKFAFVAYACVWPVLLNTISGVESVDPLLVKSRGRSASARSGPSRRWCCPPRCRRSSPASGSPASFSLLVLIAAELVGANSGLGFLITYSQQNFAIPNMYAAIITMSMIGIVLNQLLLAARTPVLDLARRPDDPKGSRMSRRLHMNLFIHDIGHHEAAWRLPESRPFSTVDLEHYVTDRAVAEAAKLDSIFFADGLATAVTGERNLLTAIEPTDAAGGAGRPRPRGSA